MWQNNSEIDSCSSAIQNPVLLKMWLVHTTCRLDRPSQACKEHVGKTWQVLCRLKHLFFLFLLQFTKQTSLAQNVI